MSLSCSCAEWYPEPGDVVYYPPDKYTTLQAKRPRKCTSCGKTLQPGDTVGLVARVKIPDTDIECRIYGEDGEIPRADHYMCERCTDLFFSLDELGFCVSPYLDQRELVAEYAKYYGKKEPTE